MLKNLIRLEHKIGEKVYHFLCDTDSPIGEVKEALMQFGMFATQVSNTPPPVQPAPVEAPRETPEEE
jgi:hypothetical protein